MEGIGSNSMFFTIRPNGCYAKQPCAIWHYAKRGRPVRKLYPRMHRKIIWIQQLLQPNINHKNECEQVGDNHNKQIASYVESCSLVIHDCYLLDTWWATIRYVESTSKTKIPAGWRNRVPQSSHWQLCDNRRRWVRSDRLIFPPRSIGNVG